MSSTCVFRLPNVPRESLVDAMKFEPASPHRRTAAGGGRQTPSSDMEDTSSVSDGSRSPSTAYGRKHPRWIDYEKPLISNGDVNEYGDAHESTLAREARAMNVLLTRGDQRLHSRRRPHTNTEPSVPPAIARWFVKDDTLTGDDVQYLCDRCVVEWRAARTGGARLITEYTDRGELT
jgi:hypothetical protein